MTNGGSHIVDRGDGPAVVLVPGIQGRWEYLRRTVDALARACRVITFSLCDEPASGGVFDPSRGLSNYTDQIQQALDRLGLEAAAICGISFGGLIALRLAAARPDRITSLVLASTPGPRWHLRRSHEIYATLPWLFAPLFFAGAPLRLRAEMAAALPDRSDRRRFVREQIATLRQSPLSPARMAARARLITAGDSAADSARVTAPTLVLTGDPNLDHIVAADGTSEYATLIRGARTATLEQTGHLGSVTKPEAFAALVSDFVAQEARASGAVTAPAPPARAVNG